MHSSVAFAVVALAASTYAWPSPEPIKGTIPGHANDLTMDPTVIRRASDNKLFLFTTGQTGNNHWTADSLSGPWTLATKKVLDASDSLGAPQVYNVGGQYYMYHSGQFNYSSIGVTNPDAEPEWHAQMIMAESSSTMEPGSWTAHGRLNITWSEDYNILDAELITVGSGKKLQNFLQWGSYYDGIFQVPLADPPVELAANGMADLKHLIQNTTTELNPTEGSFMFQWGQYYYMLWSEGYAGMLEKNESGKIVYYWPDAGDAYKVMVCRSSSPNGGFVGPHGKSCLEAGGAQIMGSSSKAFATGGGGFLNDTELGPVLYYHYVNTNASGHPTVGYKFGFNKLHFGADGWPTVIAPSS